MDVKSRIIELPPEEKYRLIVMSDIHGGFNLYKKLIEKVKLEKKDYLILLGDFIEKGPRSKKLLEEIKKISKHKNRIIISGNCEAFISYLMKDINNCEKIYKYMETKPYRSIFDDWIDELNININEITPAKLHTKINNTYKDDVNFISTLPIGLEFDKFIFVHGGIDHIHNWKDSSFRTILACDEFYKKGHKSDKTVIVGHWPTSNYKNFSGNGDVIIDEKKRIICIDGGYGVKIKGQMNALIIEKNGKDYNIFSEKIDDFTRYKVIEKNRGSEKIPEKLGWPYNKIKIIEKKEEFSLCERIYNRERINVTNELIKYDGKEYYCDQDYQEYFLTVNKGDQVRVAGIYGKYALARFKDEYGWIETKKIARLE
jgi:protein phosphatase